MATILLTGATGMIGKGILLEAIEDSRIDSIVLINRSPIDVQHPKIREVILKDFLALETVKDDLGIPDACFHCMGISSVGLSEEEYTRLTYDVTKKLADLCYDLNPGMTFNYVSGQGTDTASRQMWARVKGQTEDYVRSKGFARCYLFRPGVILPENGIRSRTKLYDRAYVVLRPLFPLLKRMSSVTTTTKIAQAMIATLFQPQQEQQYLLNRDINALVVP